MKKLFTKVFLCIIICSSTHFLQAQSIPIQIINQTGLPDSAIFIGIVGQDLTTAKKYIWVDVLTGQQNFMKSSDNTITGPAGSSGPNGTNVYADCFQPLSKITNNTIPLEKLQGCRIFLAQKEQLYLYFYDQLDTFGYAAPNLTNPTDPNTGLIYEFIEVTFDNNGFFGNTTRVDAYHRPISLEVFGDNGNFQKRLGEEATHKDIISRFPGSVPSEFQGCLMFADSIIVQPSKTTAFLPGGMYDDYFDSYVDQIWTKYTNEDLVFDGGDLGTCTGRVNASGAMNFTCTAMTGTGTISQKPTTIEVIEGSGVLAEGSDEDKNVQKFVCAAINRHVLDVTSTNPGTQIWSDSSKYYKTDPANFYAAYWHQQGISIDELSYGFAYDDVFDYSSSIKNANPDSVKIYFGDQNITLTSAEELAPKQNLKAFPNSTSGLCTIQGIEGSETLQVFDLNGRLMHTTLLQAEQQETEIDLSNFSTGLYIVKVQTGSITNIVKVLKR